MPITGEEGVAVRRQAALQAQEEAPVCGEEAHVCGEEIPVCGEEAPVCGKEEQFQEGREITLNEPFYILQW